MTTSSDTAAEAVASALDGVIEPILDEMEEVFCQRVADAIKYEAKHGPGTAVARLRTLFMVNKMKRMAKKTLALPSKAP